MIEDIKGLSISDRALEFIQPALLLSYKYRMTDYDGKIFNEVLATLSSFVKERSQRSPESLQGRLHPFISGMVELEGWTLKNEKIFSMACIELGGKKFLANLTAFMLKIWGCRPQ
jgi:hypothetical protein